MKHMIPLLLTLCLSLLGGEAKAPAAPYFSGPEGWESLPPRKVEENAAHLMDYENFAHYNETGFFNDFFITEASKDGALFYRLKSGASGVEILVDANQTTAQVSCGEAVFSFSIPLLGSIGSSSGVFQTADLTGDGSPELIYTLAMTGSGYLDRRVRVFNLSGPEEYKVERYDHLLLSKITVTPLAILDHSRVLFQVEDQDGGVQYGASYVSEALPLEAYRCAPTGRSGRSEVHLSNAGDGLAVSAAFQPEGGQPGGWLGTVEGRLSFQPNSKSFVLTGPYTVLLTEPAGKTGAPLPAGP